MLGSLKRIQRELNQLSTKASVGYEANPIDNNDMYTWQALIEGPESTPYSGGIFKLLITFPKDYPFKPPKVKFTTKIFHPNIDKLGNISISILDLEWSPALTILNGIKIVHQVLDIIYMLLVDPSPECPMDINVAEIYKTNYLEFFHTARDWTIEYAKQT